MGQFGGATRNDDYDFFTAPARPAATNGFGGGPPAGGQFGGPPPARHAPPPRPPGASRGRSGIVLPLLLAFVLVLGVAGVAAAKGLIPGVGSNGGTASAPPPPGDSPYTAKPPKKLLGLTLSTGGKAKQIDAAFRSGGGFAGHPLTTFVYVDGQHEVRVFGAVLLAPLTGPDQRAFMAGATSSLSADGQGTSVAKLTVVKPGKLGGSMRCGRLGTVPASTQCLFSDRGSAGVVVVLGKTGAAAVAKARETREAVVHRH